MRQLLVVVAMVALWAGSVARLAADHRGNPPVVRAEAHVFHALTPDEPEPPRPDEVWEYRPQTDSGEFTAVRLARYGNRASFQREYSKIWGLDIPGTGTWTERGATITLKYASSEEHFERRGNLLLWHRPANPHPEEKLNLQLMLQTTQDEAEQRKLEDRLRGLCEETTVELKPVTADERTP